MLRGTKKQIIHLKHTESPLFEEAFLIVKHSPPAGMSARTLAEEANRLLSEKRGEEAEHMPLPSREKRMKWVIPAFLLGAVSGAAILTLCLLL